MPRRDKRLLIIDDDKIFCDTLAGFLRGEGMEVLIANNGSDGLSILSMNNIDVVLLDQNLPDVEGYTLCPEILRLNDSTKIIFITAYPSIESAVVALKAGAHDYLSKPFELESLRLSINRSFRTLELESIEMLQRYNSEKIIEDVNLVGSSPGLEEIRRLIQLASASEAPVLITGETGTGKNLVAKAIHYERYGTDSPLVNINCAALSENLIEDELFGHEKGAFSGAITAKRGIFELAEGGTLVLDEIGEMPMHLQSKLLSVIEDKKVKRLGGETFKQVNVRVMATTNIDIEDAIRDSKFRKDLFYRLGVIRIHVPPLRERPQDIPDLCDYLVKKNGKGKITSIPDSDIERLCRYDWPGNVRELQNIIERSMMILKDTEIRPADLLVQSRQDTRPPAPLAKGFPDGAGTVIKLDEIEKQYIKFALEKLKGNYTRTAIALGISLSTLKRKVKEFGLN